MSTAAILLSLTLGVGLNVAIFSIADQAALRSLPVSSPQTLAQLQWDGAFPVQGLGGVGWGHRRLRGESSALRVHGVGT